VLVCDSQGLEEFKLIAGGNPAGDMDIDIVNNEAVTYQQWEPLGQQELSIADLRTSALSQLPASNASPGIVEKSSITDMNVATQRIASIIQAGHSTIRPEFLEFKALYHDPNTIYELTFNDDLFAIYCPISNAPDSTIPIYVCFRGSQTLFDLYQDVNILKEWAEGSAASSIANNVQEITQLINTHLNHGDRLTTDVIFSGFSLGGLYALEVYHEYMQHFAKGRVRGCVVFQPYIVPTPGVREIFDICSDPTGPDYDRYRTDIVIHSTMNDFASILTQSSGRFATIYKYPAQSTTFLDSWTGMSWLQMLSTDNHKMSNFIAPGREVNELQAPLADITSNSLVDMKTEDAGMLIQYPSISGARHLFYADLNSGGPLQLAHPEVISVEFEKYRWTFLNRTPIPNFPRFEVVGNSVSFMMAVQSSVGTVIHFYPTLPSQHSEITVSPLDSNSVVMQICQQGVSGGKSRLFPISPDLSGPSWNIHLPYSVILTEQLDQAINNRAIVRFDTDLYAHQGHRRTLSPIIPAGIPIDGYVRLKTPQNKYMLSYTSGTAVTTLTDSSNYYLLCYNDGTTHFGNNDPPLPSASLPPDEYVWQISIDNNYACFTNTETNGKIENINITHIDDVGSDVNVTLSRTLSDGTQDYLQIADHGSYAVVAWMSTLMGNPSVTTWTINPV